MIRRCRDTGVLARANALEANPVPLLSSYWRHSGVFPYVPPPRVEFHADVGLGLNDNDPVATWWGRSLNGESSTQSAAGNKPTFKASGGPGGRPCIDFDGGDMLELNSAIPGQAYTAVCVFKYSDTNPRTIIGGTGSGFQLRTNGNKLNALSAAAADLGSNSTTLSSGTFFQGAVTCSQTRLIFYLGGGEDGNIGISIAFGGDVTRIGVTLGGAGGENFLGSICMVKLWNCVLTPVQIAADYAKNFARWGV
jgi:hypothetical protein